jgi:hypothetical protein
MIFSFQGLEGFFHYCWMPVEDWAIVGFRREADENCLLMGYYPASGGNFLPKFWDNLAIPSAGIKNPNESQLSQCGVYTGKSVGCGKSHCQPIGLMQMVGREIL